MLDYLAAGFSSWWDFERFLSYFFSLGSLSRTLFSGWHRDSNEGFEWWQRLILGLVTMLFGLIVRLVVIALGLAALAIGAALLPVFLILPVRMQYENLVKAGSIGKSWAYGASYELHHHGIALYKGADKKLFERAETVTLITRVLSREEKDNVILVGAPGSGKSTVVGQFAKEVYRGLVPNKLKNREVIEIPIADMPVDEVKKMFAEAREAGNVIAVLKEPEKYQGLLDELMPLVTASELQVIVVTSLDGYVSGWRDREDVLRYFERIDVAPLSSAAALALLGEYVARHYPKMKFEKGVLEEIVRRTDELVQAKLQPEKSIDLLEELAVGTKEISIRDVDRTLSEQTGVPLGAIERDEKRILLTLEDALKKEIVGQAQAVNDVAAALRRARTGVASKKKPIGSFLFLGPTGVGKTYTAQTLAKHYFGGAGVMTRFDMSEFALASAAPSFIKRLTLSIEENPYGLLFFDELEKADKAIWNTLLQVLDEGRLTSARGETVSFTNTIIIATSNAGTAEIEAHPETTKDALVAWLIANRLFSPEFLNRFDDVVLFHPLTKEDAGAVTRLLLSDLNDRLSQERGITVEITDSLVRELVENGFNPKNGARALRRAVQDRVENAVADAILRDAAAPGTCLTIG